MITKIRKRDGRLVDYDIGKIENAIAKAMIALGDGEIKDCKKMAKIAELEPAFATVLVELVKKVTNVAYDNHKEVLIYLLETGLGFAQKDTYFDVLLSEEDYKKYASLFPKLQEHYKDKFALEFKKSVDLPDGSCKLENENRVIECGVGTRLSGLLEELALLG